MFNFLLRAMYVYNLWISSETPLKKVSIHVCIYVEWEADFETCSNYWRGNPWYLLRANLRGALGFSVLRFWLFFRSVFRFLLQNTSVFRFWWSLQFADFSFVSIWFSVFVKNTSGFSVLVPDVVFGFSYFVLFWVSVSVRFEQHLISNSRETPKLFRGMRDKINVMVGYQASPLTPGEPLTSQTRATIWSVCELWLPTCLPRQQRKKQLWIVLRFFTRRGVIKW